MVQLQDFGSAVASAARRFVAESFLDQVIVVHPDVAPSMWDAVSTTITSIPGLPRGQNYRGAKAFQGFLLLWQGITLQWCDQNDYTTWIPISATASNFVFNLLQPYTLGEYGVESDVLIVDQNPTGLTPGQFMRIDAAAPNYCFFTVGSVLPASGVSGIASGFTQTVGPSATQDIFLQSYVPYEDGENIYFASQPTVTMQVNGAAPQPSGAVSTLTAGFISPTAGNLVTVSIQAATGFVAGNYLSIGTSQTPGQDIYQVQSVNNVALTMVLQRIGVGSYGGGGHQAGEYLVGQSSINVTNLTTTATTSYFAEPINEVYGFTLIPYDLTGDPAVGQVYPIGTQVFTMNANGAGTVQNTGANINGPILHVETLGDMAYIFKRRSIQSIQYTGIGNGTFFIRPETQDEGLVGDYAFVKVSQNQVDTLYFWGNKGLYIFLGGGNMQPFAQQHYKQMRDELDLSRANQIIGYHNERDYEIWFIYPRNDQAGAGALRVFIFNYVEGSATIDDYPYEISSLTAAGRIDWNQDLVWSGAQGTWANPISFSPTATWASLASDNDQSFTLLGHQAGAPPVYPTMTLQAARDLYVSAFPGVISATMDPLQFLNWFNQQLGNASVWGTAFPPVINLNLTAQIIAQAFGYVVGQGIPAYFLGSAPSATPGIVAYDNYATSRNQDPVLCRYESVDHDGGDPLSWKYADTQWFSIQTKSRLSVSMPILVYLGSKANYDDTVVWSQPIVLYVQGNRNYVTKTNVLASGRFFRIKVVAATPGLQFRISQARILGRLGSTY